MAKSYVKALYDYSSGEPGDLIFETGDLIQVLSQIDENWIKGEHHGNIGLFPANFVEPMAVSAASGETTVSHVAEKIVVAKETYISGDDAVLTFFRGDELTFLNFVDDYWCRGSYAGEVGLFPAHVVDGLDDDPLLPQIKDDTPTIQLPNLSPNNPDSTKTTPQGPHARALFDFRGVLDFELSFPVDQLIVLTKDVDEEWYEGSCSGSTGIFPKSFVEVLVPLPAGHASDKVETSEPYAVAVYPFVGETSSELSFREGDLIILHHWVSPEWIQGECNGHTGIFPSTFVQIERELQEDFDERGNLEGQLGPQEEAGNSLFKTGGKALAIYSYVTDIEGDLRLEVGDLISIEGVIDDEWVLGRKDEYNVGLCPAVFLELKEESSLNNFETNAKFSGANGESSLSEIHYEKLNNQDSRSFPFNDGGNSAIGQKVESGLHSSQTGTTFQSSSDESTLSSASSEKIGDQDMKATVINQIGSKNNVKPPDVQSVQSTSWTDTDRIPGSTSTEPQPYNLAYSPTEPSPTYPSLTSIPPEITVRVSPLKSPQNSTGQLKQTSTTNTTKFTKSKPKALALGPKPPLAPKPIISPKPDFLKKPEKPLPPPKPVTPTEKSPGFLKPNARNEHNWVTFEDENRASIIPQATETKPRPAPMAPARSKTSPDHRLSYKDLLNKSLEEDLTSSHTPEPNKARPVPPPRVDLTNGGSSDALSKKLMEQADQFEKSSSRQNSPSLNELRALSQSQKPVPARRSKLPSKPFSYSGGTIAQGQSDSNNGFPIFDELDEQITKFKKELQKEDKVLSGVDVLIETVNKDTSRREELESKKRITERKIEDLKRQLKKTEDKRKRLAKLVAGYSSQEQIRLKIQQLQETIKENADTRNNLQSLLSDCGEDEVRNELQDNITFCDEAVKNLQSELNTLQDLVAELEGKVLKNDSEKNVTHRKKVIDEILNTEKSFAGDLNLCLKNFKMQLIEWRVESIDCDMLFGNMDEVAALSSRLLQRLETATKNVDIHHQIIGTCFVEFSEEMTIVYGKYCRNHDEAIAFLEKSADNDEIQQYFRKCLESIREFSNCWDLSSFLIKPVQRILKYPLLLNELLKNTPDDHPDKPGLIKGIEVMTIAANDVNEFKRRKELVQKYQKVEESGLTTKFQKFTWHSVLKKSSRFNQRITQFTGLVSQTVDEKFNENERLFYQIEKTAKNLIKNITQYVEQFEDVQKSQVHTAENIVDFLEENATAKDIQEYHTAQRYIDEELVNKLKHVIDEDVVSPLNTLIMLFQGPHRLIQKRHDKCLDYDSWSNKVEKIKDREKWRQAKDELELAKKNYEALNTQLLDELPVLNSKSLKFLQTCITNFACVHKNFFVEVLDQFSPSVQLSVVNPSSLDIISDFYAHNKLASHEIFQLAFTPKKSLTLTRPTRPNVSPKSSQSNLLVDDKHLKPRNLKRSASESKRRAPISPSDDGGLSRSRTVTAVDRRVLMKTKVEINVEASRTDTANYEIGGNQSYIVKYTFNAEAPTELSVNKDEIVRVLEHRDAFGHDEWWKVERDGKVGYVPSSFLAPYGLVPRLGETSMVAGKTDDLVPSTGQTCLLGHTGQTSMVPEQTSNGSLLKCGMELYHVKYDFASRGPSELGVFSGDVVKVIRQSDTSGSKEWWLVETRGKQGYVPASYLVKRE